MTIKVASSGSSWAYPGLAGRLYPLNTGLPPTPHTPRTVRGGPQVMLGHLFLPHPCPCREDPPLPSPSQAAHLLHFLAWKRKSPPGLPFPCPQEGRAGLWVHVPVHPWIVCLVNLEQRRIQDCTERKQGLDIGRENIVLVCGDCHNKVP